MNISAISRSALFKRFVSSLAAILAVSTIFGAKAVEIQHRADAAALESAHLAEAGAVSGS